MYITDIDDPQATCQGMAMKPIFKWLDHEQVPQDYEGWKSEPSTFLNDTSLAMPT